MVNDCKYILTHKYTAWHAGVGWIPWHACTLESFASEVVLVFVLVEVSAVIMSVEGLYTKKYRLTTW